jgi:hypothetical protein
LSSRALSGHSAEAAADPAIPAPRAPGGAVPPNGVRDLDELRAEAGQFFRWRFLTPDPWKTAHPFSLSAVATSTHLRLTVKSLGHGSAALQHLEPGTWVVAEGPYGAITAERRTHRHVLLVAGGLGITPMRALFESMPLRPARTCCSSTEPGLWTTSSSEPNWNTSPVRDELGCNTC